MDDHSRGRGLPRGAPDPRRPPQPPPHQLPPQARHPRRRHPPRTHAARLRPPRHRPRGDDARHQPGLRRDRALALAGVRGAAVALGPTRSFRTDGGRHRATTPPAVPARPRAPIPAPPLRIEGCARPGGRVAPSWGRSGAARGEPRAGHLRSAHPARSAAQRVALPIRWRLLRPEATVRLPPPIFAYWRLGTTARLLCYQPLASWSTWVFVLQA
jgi:hypothetical protein